MAVQSRVQRSFGRLAVVVVLAASAGHSSARAQTQPTNPGTYTLDPYGNARARGVDHRPMGVYQNDAQRELVEGYQVLTRRLARRLGSMDYAIAGDTATGLPLQLPGLPSTRMRPRAQVPPWISGLSYDVRRVFSRYGGFGRRSKDADTNDLSTVFRRRYELVGATALNAPVRRAMAESSGVFGPPPTLARMPSAPDTEPGGSTPALDLGQHLQQTVEHAHLQAKAEAWVWFREGRFRRAARAFESAAFLVPEDIEARIGEIFSYLAIGANRTALACLGELNRRDVNPFVQELNLTEVGGDQANLQEIRLSLRARAQAAGSNPDVTALYALVLWYLGDKDEATLTASNLAHGFPGSAYVTWPAKMDAARKTPAESRDRP